MKPGIILLILIFIFTGAILVYCIMEISESPKTPATIYTYIATEPELNNQTPTKFTVIYLENHNQQTSIKYAYFNTTAAANLFKSTLFKEDN